MIAPTGRSVAGSVASTLSATPGGDRRAQRSRDARAAALFLAPGVLGLLIFIVGPLFFSLGVSFFDWSLLGTPEFVSIANYQRLFTEDPNFWPIVGNTLLVVFVYVPVNVAFALGMALWLRTRIPARAFFRILFLFPALTPMVANALVWKFILADDGLLNTALGSVGIDGPNWLGDSSWALVSIIMVSVWQSFGYNMVILSAGLDAVDESLLEAARMDGASALRRFSSITLPLLTPSLFFTTVMTMIGAFQIFVQPYMMTRGGPGQSTNTLVLYLYQNGFSFDELGYASAIGWVVFSLVMVVTALQFIGQRRLVHYA